MADLPIVRWASADVDDAGSPLHEFVRLVQASGFLEGLHRSDVVAIKLHMGEHGNVRYLRPVWARVLADLVREAGARPFVTDTTSLYKHRRATVHDYLETAAMHGYTPQSMGCPVIIADGFRSAGTAVRVEDAEFQEIPVAQAIYDADALISLAHPTFHAAFPLAGTLKNLGMGATTKAAKIRMHTQMGGPKYRPERCLACWTCIRLCPGNAFRVADDRKRVAFAEDQCVGCGDCVANCPSGALALPWDADTAALQRWTLEAARAVLSTFDKGRVLHLAVGTDFTFGCDCGPAALPIIVDLGLFCSHDPVALDKACWDKAHEAALYPGGRLDRLAASAAGASLDLSADRVSPIWGAVDPDRFWGEIVPAAQLGSLEYRLLELERPG